MRLGAEHLPLVPLDYRKWSDRIISASASSGPLCRRACAAFTGGSSWRRRHKPDSRSAICGREREQRNIGPTNPCEVTRMEHRPLSGGHGRLDLATHAAAAQLGSLRSTLPKPYGEGGGRSRSSGSGLTTPALVYRAKCRCGGVCAALPVLAVHPITVSGVTCFPTRIPGANVSR